MPPLPPSPPPMLPKPKPKDPPKQQGVTQVGSTVPGTIALISDDDKSSASKARSIKRQKELTKMFSFDIVDFKTKCNEDYNTARKSKRGAQLRLVHQMDAFPLKQTLESNATMEEGAGIDTSFEVTNATIERVDSRAAKFTKNASGTGGDVEEFIDNLKEGLDNASDEAEKELNLWISNLDSILYSCLSTYASDRRTI
ncbi:unknown protein [Seminavis robusta]|uniref:Uncharacterized protein n=1 Tax=Seminavis robusta TaxID=568900 RepID=A0A9N8F0L7_9STRA|nr:unknown protein [Seminavis robusta]|eukprot:Sro2168_g317330.1 n/a (198) ;mRNA; f:4469-5062